jgi:hypothetical protein
VAAKADGTFGRMRVEMQGIQFLTDARGKRVAVQIDLKRHSRLWEDFEDVLVANSRRREKNIPIDRVKASLIRRGRLSG